LKIEINQRENKMIRLSKKHPTDLTFEEENPTHFQSLLFEDICGETYRKLLEILKKSGERK